MLDWADAMSFKSIYSFALMTVVSIGGYSIRMINDNNQKCIQFLCVGSSVRSFFVLGETTFSYLSVD